MSPRELRHEFKAAEMRRRDEAERDLSFAWYVAALSRQERLPRLQTLVSNVRAIEDGHSALVTQVQSLSKQLGLPVRPMSDEARAAWRRMRES